MPFHSQHNKYRGLNYVKYASEEIVKIKIQSYLTGQDNDNVCRLAASQT